MGCSFVIVRYALLSYPTQKMNQAAIASLAATAFLVTDPYFLLQQRMRKRKFLFKQIRDNDPLRRQLDRERFRVSRPGRNHPPYSRVPFDINNKTDLWCLEFLRFTKSQVQEIAVELNLENCILRKRYTATPTTMLALVLYRLSSPTRYKDLCDVFGHGTSWLESIFNDTITFIYENQKELLYWDSTRLTSQQIAVYCDAIKTPGNLGLCYGFIDATHRAICKPGTTPQRLFYSGYKKIHSIKFQAITTPDGIISHLDGKDLIP